VIFPMKGQLLTMLRLAFLTLMMGGGENQELDETTFLGRFFSLQGKCHLNFAIRFHSPLLHSRLLSQIHCSLHHHFLVPAVPLGVLERVTRVVFELILAFEFGLSFLPTLLSSSSTSQTQPEGYCKGGHANFLLIRQLAMKNFVSGKKVFFGLMLSFFWE